MFKKTDQYLLTHYPLIWNTRVLWVLLTNLGLFLLFSVAGFFAVTPKSMGHYYGVSGVGGGLMYALSALFSLLVCIVWLVWYLRNNAFKNFYRIGRGHLAREFFLIILIVFTSLIYFEGFNLGVRTRVRSITGTPEFVRELNAVNRGMAFIPVSKAPYFVFNSCENQNRKLPDFDETTNYNDLDQDELARDSAKRMIRERITQPGAFSYEHYCRLEFPYDSYHLQTKEEQAAWNYRLLATRNVDSVRKIIEACLAVCRKYGVDYNIDAAGQAAIPFATADHRLGKIADSQSGHFDPANNHTGERFLESYVLNYAISLVDECQPESQNDYHDREFLAIVYLATGFSILLFIYRRFSRKVFLVSVVGSLVWGILIGLLGGALNFQEQSFFAFMIFLTLAFLVAALAAMNRRGTRTAAGALLCWHLYLVPFLGFDIIMWNEGWLNNIRYSKFEDDYEARNAWVRLHYPVSNWINENKEMLVMASLALIILYITFIVNNWIRKWQAMAEE